MVNSGSSTYRKTVFCILYYTSCSSLVKKNSKGQAVCSFGELCFSMHGLVCTPCPSTHPHAETARPRAGPRYVCHSELLLYSCINAPEGGVPTWHTHKIMGRTAQLLYTHPGHTPVSLCREEYEGKANTFLGTVGSGFYLLESQYKVEVKQRVKLRIPQFSFS